MDEKLNVIICLPSLSIGGAETMSSQLAKNIDKTKFNVSFIVNHSRKDNRIMDILSSDPELKVYFLDEDKGISLRAIRKMNKLLKQLKPDIIHTHLHSYPYVALYAMRHKVKILHTIHNMPIFESKKSGRKILKFLFKHKYAIPVGISRIISQETNELYKITNTPTIYNPVDVNKFYCEKKQEHSDFTFITVGRMSEQKNQKLLLETFYEVRKERPNIQLLFAGDGVLKDGLVTLANKLDLDNVKFLGNVTDIEKYYAQSDVFVLSSIYEGLPMTILEAMAAGLAIVSTDVGGVKDIVTNNGLLVPSGNLEALKKAMIELIDDKQKLLELSKNSFDDAQKFDIKEIARQYEDLYCQYAKKRRRLNEKEYH